MRKPSSIDITRRREAEATIILMGPVRLIMSRFISYSSEIREFIVRKSARHEHLSYRQKILLICFLQERFIFPGNWIILILEHIDTHMFDTKIRIEKLSDVSFYLSRSNLWKSKDEVYVHVRKRFFFEDIEGLQGKNLARSTNGLKTLKIQCLDSETQSIHTRLANSSHELFGDIFWIRLERYFDITRKI
jgi:hypothetical protein